MKLSKRMSTVAHMVNKCNTVADIGTDHGYVPIYLVKNQIAKKAFACDINKGPLEKAQININSYNCNENIETRLGSGLTVIKPFEVDTAIIAGMGGMLIIDILKDSIETVQSLKQLVLQPQLDIGEVRKYIHSIGFKIEDEEMLIDEGKYYTVINAVKGNEKYENEIEYFFGKCLINKKSEVLKKYAQFMADKTENIIKNLSDNNSESAILKKSELEKENRLYREVLECL